jgi:hypothetical protein
MTYENYIKAKLVDVAIEDAYHQGGSDPMLAVAQVMANRVKAGWNDWQGVIDNAAQTRGTQWADRPKIDPRDGGFRELLRKVDDIYHGIADDTNVNLEEHKSLYYAELNNITNPWFQENILNDLDEHPRIATVGQLTFFA